MRLEMMNAADVGIRIRSETDPVMMAELGGPRPVAGSVIVFPNSHEGEDLFEIGWMIFPAFQNRGVASEAVRRIVEKARVERRFGLLHAFPTVTNVRSNRICEKNGFTNVGHQDFTYAGRRLHCNRWRIELWPGAETEVRA